MASRRTRGTGGRILPHERDVNNLVPIMGAEFTDLGDNYTFVQRDASTWYEGYNPERLLATQHQSRKVWGEHYPEYYPVGTRDVPAEDLEDQRKFFYGRYKKDLVYKGLNVKYFIKFLMAIKKKENGHFLSFTDLRKYKDAILWAASMAEERLPTTFYEEIEKFLKGYKK